MKDIWYSDNRDIVKWSTLLRLAELYGSSIIFQVAYYRYSKWNGVEIDGRKYDLPQAIKSFFRDIRNVEKLCSKPKIAVYVEVFHDRQSYHKKILPQIGKLPSRAIIFLDPDTGLEPPSGRAKPEHVLKSELRTIWDSCRKGDLLVLYQHQTNRMGKPWIENKKLEFEGALGNESVSAKIARADIARDVVFFFAEKC